MSYIILILVAILAYVLGRKMAGGLKPKQDQELADLRIESKEALGERTDQREQKILEYMRTELEHQKELEGCHPGAGEEGISRIEIEKLLDVSDDTARKYLNELENRGEIRQIGDSGRGVRYALNVRKPS